MEEPVTNTTSTYSESQKLALHYKELAADPSWRPRCLKCWRNGRGARLMIKTKEAGFYCVCCGFKVNCYMHQVKGE